MARTYDLSVLFRVIDRATSPLRKVGRSISNLSKPLVKATKDFKKLGETAKAASEKMGKVGRNLSLKLTAPIALLGGIATKSAIDFESAFTGVRKTVEATESQFGILKKGLMDMALKVPIATEEIFGIAEAAGQLGVKQEDILSFTKVMADLGATTNITAAEAAMSLAKFAKITGMAYEDIEALGSTIVELGNNTATTERDIVAMGMRLAGAGNTIGLTEAQIMSLAASLSSVGLEAEAGGTAFSMIMKRIGKEVGTGSEAMDKFSNIARKSTAEFEKAWKEDAGLALIDVIEGLGELQKRGKNVNIILDDMGFKGIRISDAMLRASGAGDEFRRTLALGNKAMKENNALSKEAALRYATSKSQLIMAKTRAEQMAVTFGAVLVPAILKVLKFLEPVVDWLGKLSPTTKVIIVVVAGLAAAIGPLLIALGLMASGLAVITAIGAPVLAVIAAISAAVVGVGAAITQVIDNWKWLKEELSEGAIGKIGGWIGSLAKRYFSFQAGMGGGETEPGGETPLPSAGAKGLVGAAGAAGETKTEVILKVQADEGTTATVEKVKKKKGDAGVSVATIGYVGAH